VCYRDRDDARAGSLVLDAARGRRVGVLGQADVLRNANLDQDGNAALALRLLGGRPRVVWYWPDPAEAADAGLPASLSDLVPSRVWWALAQVVIAILVALAWRARRLGRLVVEPLPVIVRSAETQEGRARLYRQAGARGRAGATLRTAAMRRLARRLDLPAQTSPEEVAALVAAASGADEVEVRATMIGPPPTDDAALVRLARALDTLESGLDAPGRDRTPAVRTPAVRPSGAQEPRQR
jgi:hypothetical protein